jgi:hypothetical protein
MTDTMTSQNIDLFSWDILYIKTPCNRVSALHRAPLGNLERIRLPGLLERNG